VTAAAPAAAVDCLVLASHPDGKPLAQFEAPRGTFAIGYVHSVTRTPVDERYRVERGTIVQTRGLPTEADAGGTWTREGGAYVVTMERRLDTIAMRVHADQKPQLVVDGDPRVVNLAQWGNRSVALSARAGACLTGPTGYGAR
jgi:hypothetical protein